MDLSKVVSVANVWLCLRVVRSGVVSTVALWGKVAVRLSSSNLIIIEHYSGVKKSCVIFLYSVQ